MALQGQRQCILRNRRQHAKPHMARQAKRGGVTQFDTSRTKLSQVTAERRASAEKISVAAQTMPTQSLQYSDLAFFPNLQGQQTSGQPSLHIRLYPSLQQGEAVRAHWP